VGWLLAPLPVAMVCRPWPLWLRTDQGTWLIRRPRELPARDLPELIELGRRGAFTELYQRCRVKIKDERATTPAEPLFNITRTAGLPTRPARAIFYRSMTLR